MSSLALVSLLIFLVAFSEAWEAYDCIFDVSSHDQLFLDTWKLLFERSYGHSSCNALPRDGS